MNHFRRLLLIAAPVAAAAVLLPLRMAQAEPPPIRVVHAWSRATPPHVPTGVVYMTLTSPAGDMLVGASTPVARQASLHQTLQQDGMTEMRPVAGGIDLPAGKPVALAPDGYHLMLEGLAGPLEAGKSFPLHLTFARAAPVDVMVSVRPLGAAGSAMSGMAMSGMQMQGMQMQRLEPTQGMHAH